jgi:hypothetical protein
MNDIHMTFDELLTMKALLFKSSLSGRTSSAFVGSMLEKDETQAEAIGMKNMCFRVSPLLQARFEVSLDALGMSKQEALTEALQEMLNRYDAKLREVGLGPLEYENRLKELGFALSPPDDEGSQRLVRIPKEGE